MKITAEFDKGHIPVMEKVEGWILRSNPLLGVNRLLQVPGWGVTHIPTGHLVCSAKTRKMALAAAAVLSDLDWNFRQPEEASRLGSKVRATLQEIGFKELYPDLWRKGNAAKNLPKAQTEKQPNPQEPT